MDMQSAVRDVTQKENVIYLFRWNSEIMVSNLEESFLFEGRTNMGVIL
jgi:hypothetical protein